MRTSPTLPGRQSTSLLSAGTESRADQIRVCNMVEGIWHGNLGRASVPADLSVFGLDRFFCYAKRSVYIVNLFGFFAVRVVLGKAIFTIFATGSRST